MTDGLTACHRKAYTATKIPRLKMQSHKSIMQWYDQQVTFQTLRNMGWEHQEAWGASKQYSGTAKERLARIFK